MKTYKARPVLMNGPLPVQSAVFKADNLVKAREWVEKYLTCYHKYWSIEIK